MSRLAVVLLMLRLAIKGTLRASIDTLTGVLGAAVGVLLVLIGFSLYPAAEARADRIATRLPVSFTPLDAGSDVGGGLLLDGWEDRYKNEPIASFRVATIGPSSLLPPGLSSVPRPGEVVVSPEMARLLAEPESTLRTRYPGRIAGVVSPAGLVGPRELVVWSGTSEEKFSRETRIVTGFGRFGADGTEIPAELHYAVPLAAVGFLLPVLTLFTMAATLGTANRERRLAALRLVGLTSGQTRLLSALEAGVVSLVGLLGGSILFVVLRAILSNRVPLTGGVWPSDATPSASMIALLVLGLPILTVATTWISLRAVETTPLAVTRRSRKRRLRHWRLAPILAGIVFLCVSAVVRSTSNGVTLSGLSLVTASVLIVAGLAIGAPLITRYIARAAHRCTERLSVHIAARRVDSDPNLTARIATGTALMIYASGFLLSFFQLLETANAVDYRKLQSRIGNQTFVSVVQPPLSGELDAIRAAIGVHGVLYLPRIEVAVKGSSSYTSAAVASCHDLNQVLIEPLLECADVQALVAGRDTRLLQMTKMGADLAAVTTVESAAGKLHVKEVGDLGLTSRPVVSKTVSDMTSVLAGGAIIFDQVVPEAVIDRAETGSVIVSHDGSSSEHIRTAVVRATGGGVVRSAGELVEDAERTSARYRNLTLFALAFAAMIAAVSLTVTMLEQIRAQRRSLVALWFCGTSLGTLRSAALYQCVMAVVPVSLIALGLSVASSAVFLRLDSQTSLNLPIMPLLTLATGAAILPLVVTSMTLPALQASTRPTILQV